MTIALLSFVVSGPTRKYAPSFASIGGGRGQWLGGTMAIVEHEPITGVRGQSPQRGPKAEPLV